MDHNRDINPHSGSSQQREGPQRLQEAAHSQLGAQPQPEAGPSTPAPPPYESIVQELAVQGTSSVPAPSAGELPPIGVEIAVSSASHDDDDDLPALEPAQPIADAVSRATNPRRARVDDEEDEDDQRQTNRQRMQSPPNNLNDSSNDHQFHPDMHAHAEEHRQQRQQQAPPHTQGPAPDRPPLPFNRFSFHIDIHPFGGMPGAPHTHPNQPQPPAGGAAAPLPPISFEVRFPFPAEGANGATPHVHPVPGPDGATDFSAVFQRLLREQLAQMGGIGGLYAEEPDDPRRAKRLLAGLEEVPEGLVRRMERVAGDEGVVCAVCFDSLLNSESEQPSDEKKEAASDATPMDVDAERSSPSPTASESTAPTSEEDKKADEELDHKIIVLPCAHVFHASCLRPWFTRPHRTTCPTCRFDIDPESLTYAPPARRPRTRTAPVQPAGQAPQPAGAPTGAAAQGGEQPSIPLFIPIPAPVPSGVTAPHPPQAAAGAAPAPAPDAPQDGQDPAHPHDVPFIIFDVSMLLPMHTAGQPGQQAPAAPHAPVFAAAPPAAENGPAVQPGALQAGLSAIEHILAGRGPAPAGAPRRQPAPTPAATPAGINVQPQPIPAANFQNPQGPQGPRVHWHTFPGSPLRGQGAAPQTRGPPPSFGNLFANLFGLGRQRNNANNANAGQQPQPQAEAQAQAPPAPATNAPNAATAAPDAQHNHPNPLAHPPLPSFEEFMNLVGLSPDMHIPGQPEHGARPQQAAPTADVPRPGQPQAANLGPNAPFADGLRDFAISVLDQIFPPGMFMPVPPTTGAGAGAGAAPGQPHAHPHVHHHHHHAPMPMPPPGPIPFTVPTSPRPRPAPEKRQWTPPVPPGPTLRERVEKKERELGLRCSDISCGLGPSDEDPEPVIDASKVRQVAIHPPRDKEEGAESVCEHRFHPACLVSAERVAGWSGADVKDEKEGEEEVQVSCPVCRAVGCISREDWDEGACALA